MRSLFQNLNGIHKKPTKCQTLNDPISFTVPMTSFSQAMEEEDYAASMKVTRKLFDSMRKAKICVLSAIRILLIIPGDQKAASWSDALEGTEIRAGDCAVCLHPHDVCSTIAYTGGTVREPAHKTIENEWVHQIHQNLHDVKWEHRQI